MQRHLGADMFQGFHLEVCIAHPGLDRAEGMFDSLAPQPHFLRVFVKASLDSFEDLFVFPSPDPAFFTCRTLELDGAVLALVGPVAA